MPGTQRVFSKYYFPLPLEMPEGTLTCLLQESEKQILCPRKVTPRAQSQWTPGEHSSLDTAFSSSKSTSWAPHGQCLRRALQALNSISLKCACISQLGLPYQNARLDGLAAEIHCSGGYKCKIKVWAGLVSPEASLLGVQMAIFSAVSLYGLFSVLEHFWCLFLFL